MHALTVETLVRKAKVQPETAVALGEAIDVAIENAQLVTIPVLDSRINVLDGRITALRADLKADMRELRGELRVEMHAQKAELVRWVFMVMLGNVALTAGVTAILNLLQR